jgi:hypothetical protein
MSGLKRMAQAAALALSVASAASAGPGFDPAPWRADLAQVKAAMIAHYANLAWVVSDRGLDLPALFADTDARLSMAQDQGDARRVLERLVSRIGDAHFAFEWKSAAAPGGAEAPAAVSCAGLGYNAAMVGAPVAARAPGYRALATPQSAEFPIGLIDTAQHHVGVVSIGLFEPQGFLALCESALKALAVPRDAPCNDDCAARISRWAHVRMTEDLAAQLHALAAAGADTLLVDIANNGGGSEWAEAAARMVTAKRLTSEAVAFIRSPGWVKSWSKQEAELHTFAAVASGRDKALLLSLAQQVHARARAAATHCDGATLWHGQKSGCDWLIPGFYASGLLASADPATLRGKPFAEMLFTPMQYPFAEGVWRGPLIVLVSRNSYSAAEEFAAVLQDNHAAVIMGEPSGGAGCGHMLEGEEVTLRNSGATLLLPDCARLRADGSNEIRGIEPDVLIGFTPRDGALLKGRRLMDKLGTAVSGAFRER